MKEQLEVIRKQLKKELDSNRYTHTIGVMYTAAALAMRFGADIDNAIQAGLLHDCAKCIPDQDKIRLCEENNIPLSKAEYENNALIHSKLGAFLAKEKYGVTNEDILNAIAYHTTGRPNMSLLEKIIFTADYIEPGRDMAPNLKEIRTLVFEDIDQGTYKILEDTLEYLKKGNKVIDKMTENTYDYYKNLIQ